MYLVKNNKSSFYQLVYFVDAKRTTVSTRITSESEAKKFLANFSPAVKVEKPIKEKIITLTSFRDEYFEHIKLSKSKSYLRSVKLSFKHFLSFTGNLPLINIESHLLDRFITTTFSRSNSAASLYYRTLKAAFSKAESWGYISSNPFKKVKAPKVPKSHPQFITQEEFQIILSVTKRTDLKDIFVIAFYTGMRLGEILNMKWSWIDFSQKIITTKNSNGYSTKSKKERTIPMNEKVQQIINHKLTSLNGSSKENYIFQNSNCIKFNEDFISKQFKKIIRKAKLSDEIHFHTLRHSFASILVQRGVSLYVVKELLGHEDIKTTQVYSHLTQVSLLNAVNLL
jgi:site-specific recombinase XerD